MAEKFKKGDVVQLNSGGPKMTVSDPSTLSDLIYCQWFAGNKLESGGFPPESLVKPGEEDKSGSKKS